jgi:hypothetical protein
MVLCVDQHEMGRSPAHLGTGHHQAEMFRLDVLAAGLEAVVHRRAEAGPIATQAELDTTGHVFGFRHL